ncbi:GMP reductase 2 isoform X3 [Emys orbicularis]|uniref:GMP reductase 2 isoform X3 n=1 Tax=Emys orbicularis TaxID=82168 RepID=UPI0031FE0D9E
MPHIDNNIKLDFKDVLLRPKRSTLKSRSEVDLLRSFTFRNSHQTYSGIPIIAANMDTVGTFEMAKVLCKHVAASSGTGPSDFEQLEKILEALPQVRYICLDVANGYSEHFVQFLRDVRKRFPDHTIMVRTAPPRQSYNHGMYCAHTRQSYNHGTYHPTPASHTIMVCIVPTPASTTIMVYTAATPVRHTIMECTTQPLPVIQSWNVPPNPCQSYNHGMYRLLPCHSYNCGMYRPIPISHTVIVCTSPARPVPPSWYVLSSPPRIASFWYILPHPLQSQHSGTYYPQLVPPSWYVPLVNHTTVPTP